ncbi:MAG: ATP-binding protein [Verrucomicrobiota bacterium]
MSDNQALDFQLLGRIHAAFTPSAPINKLDLFAGRSEQIQRLFGACSQPGQHVILYGERGVGKTSLARIIMEVLTRANYTLPKCGTVNCDSGDSFASIWHKALREIVISTPRPGFGFNQTIDPSESTLDDALPDEVSPDDVRAVLSALRTPAVIVIDELDRLKDSQARVLLADTIKTLSDHLSSVTVVLIGVASSVTELVAEHQSIDRALVQIHMPRMSPTELGDIIKKGEQMAHITFENEAKAMIIGLSKGLPHYTHLLCLNSALSAANKAITNVSVEYVKAALVTIVNNKTTVSTSYEHAVSSSHKDSIHEKVLMACAMCETDQDGFFSSSEIASNLSILLGKDCAVSVFSRHLSDFCHVKRGPILVRTGAERRYRYRFLDPLMQPYAIMQGVMQKLIGDDKIKQVVQLEFPFSEQGATGSAHS